MNPMLARPALLVLSIVGLMATPTVATAGISSDQERADQSVLTIDDVPPGFSKDTSAEEDPAPRGADCKDIRRGGKALDAVPNKDVSFLTPESTAGRAVINNQVSVFETTKAAKRVYAAFSGPDSETCFESSYDDLFFERLGDPGAIVDVTVDRYEPDLGDAAVGYELEIAVTAGGQSQIFYVDLEVARVGRGIAAFAFVNPGSVPPSDDVVEMTETSVDRLEDAV